MMYLGKNIIRPVILRRSIKSYDQSLKKNISSHCRVIVTPSHSLIDSPLSITGVDLPPNTPVTLTTRLTSANEKFNFSSTCRYQTSAMGTLDISKQPTLEGSSYQGIHSMGPFWSLQPEENSSKRLWPKDIRTLLDYSLNLTDEHGELLCSAETKKTFMGEGVERIEFREGRIRGTLFLPPSHLRPAPAIVTIYGGLNRKQVPEDRAAMFASHGFVSLALAFYGVDDLPKTYSSVDIEYFEEAVYSLLKHKDVLGEGVGLWGLSQGSNISLAMMAFMGNKVKSVVAVGSNFAVLNGNNDDKFEFVYKDEVIKSTDYCCELDMGTGVRSAFDFGDVQLLHNTSQDKGVVYWIGPAKDHLHDPTKYIRFERSSANLLIISGDDDPCSGGPQDQIIARTNLERAEASGKTNCHLLSYPGMGHLVDLPYAPFCSAISNPLLPRGFIMFYGGSLQPHSLGQIDAWDKTILFYERTLYEK